jgi:5-methylcytosine-specific restriction protein B
VLGDNQKKEAMQFVTESQYNEDALTRLFGNEHGLDIYATKRRYAVQDSAFSNPGAYIRIYDTAEK